MFWRIRLLVFSLASCYCLQTNAQVLGGSGYVSVGPSFMNYKSFKEFRGAYADHFEANPSASGSMDPGNLNFGSTRSFGVAFHAAYTWFELGASRSFTSTSFDFEDGTSRLFDLERRFFESYFGFGPMEEWGSFSMGVGISLGETNLSTGLQYPSGVVSYGEDAFLNGIYSSFAFRFCFSSRLSIAILDSPFALFCKMNYTPPFSNTKLEDSSRGKDLDGVFSTNYNHLPTDVYDPSTSVSYSYENVMTTKMSEFTIELGIALNIFDY